MRGRAGSEPVAELEARSSRAVGFVVLGVGGLGLALAAVLELFRGPFGLFVFTLAILIGVWRLLDRKVRLAVFSDGIRYADWGPALVPWHEFSGYAWTRWRQNPYLRLVPRRPSELAATFSPVGRLNDLGARLIRMPRFAIAVTPLDVSEAALEEAIARHLPPAAPAPSG